MVKGWAILGVTLIHSQALGDSAWMSLLFLHAVPVLIVLFGMNSEQWLGRRAAGGRTLAWYSRALERILVPTWATLCAWWSFVLILEPPLIALSPRLAVLHALGIPRHVGTGWFIAVAVQLVVLMPLLHEAVRRLGWRPVMLAALVLSIGLVLAEDALRARLGHAGWTYLSLRFAAHVVFGQALAGRLDRIGWGAMLAALACLVPLDLVAEMDGLSRPWRRVASRVSELPLTVLLLGLAAGGASLPGARILAWLGRHSLGLYLGQLLTHNFFLFALGGVCSAYACRGGVFEKLDPWLYTAVLLGGSIAWMGLGNALLGWWDRFGPTLPGSPEHLREGSASAPNRRQS